MPQGLRGRVLLFGAGVACCTGLVGCMFDEKGKTPPPVSKAKAGVATPPGARATTPDLRPTGGNGISNGAAFNPGTVPAGGYGPNPNSAGSIGAPTPPGNYGAGAPLPGQQPPVVPSVFPTQSQYPPAGTAIPAGYGSSNVPALTTARAAAPTPPTPMLADVPSPIQPPAPPTGFASPGEVVMPPTAPVGLPGPIAPPGGPPVAPRS